eukprot:TRINITY_DN123521_c0_g1_i1.p1 TRINITY_DN123521_c0_g1~~TRINITY_DN123521_c0_g1_i1.p1  ORF type:complete len:351 (+),score=58.24 TRINITY_DN123521_c0_g1_i1:56-1108(+)
MQSAAMRVFLGVLALGLVTGASASNPATTTNTTSTTTTSNTTTTTTSASTTTSTSATTTTTKDGNATGITVFVSHLQMMDPTQFNVTAWELALAQLTGMSMDGVITHQWDFIAKAWYEFSENWLNEWQVTQVFSEMCMMPNDTIVLNLTDINYVTPAPKTTTTFLFPSEQNGRTLQEAPPSDSAEGLGLELSDRAGPNRRLTSWLEVEIPTKDPARAQYAAVALNDTDLFETTWDILYNGTDGPQWRTAPFPHPKLMEYAFVDIVIETELKIFDGWAVAPPSDEDLAAALTELMGQPITASTVMFDLEGNTTTTPPEKTTEPVVAEAAPRSSAALSIGLAIITLLLYRLH